MLLNACNPLEPGQWAGTIPSFVNSAFDNWSWAPALAASWRVSYDVGQPGAVRFAGVVHNLAQATAHAEVVGAGHFADPDYLVPDQGMSAIEAQSQFSMWAMIAAPMMLSSNPATLSAPTLRMVENPEAIAISQDPLGVQGTMVAAGHAQTWVKPLANHERAVAFFNPGSSVAHGSATAATIGFLGARWLVARDVWGHRTSLLEPRITVDVPPMGPSCSGSPRFVSGSAPPARRTIPCGTKPFGTPT